MHYWEFFSLLLLLFYVGLIGTFAYGWFSIPEFKSENSASDFIRFDVLVPLRNEEAQVRRLLQNFRRLDYPLNQFSITLINDHSTDNTEREIRACMAEFPEFPFRLINVAEMEGLGSKKVRQQLKYML